MDIPPTENPPSAGGSPREPVSSEKHYIYRRPYTANFLAYPNNWLKKTKGKKVESKVPYQEWDKYFDPAIEKKKAIAAEKKARAQEYSKAVRHANRGEQ